MQLHALGKATQLTLGADGEDTGLCDELRRNRILGRSLLLK